MGRTSQPDIQVKSTDLIKSKHKSISLSPSMPSVQYKQTSKHGLGGYQGTHYFVSFCDVSTPDLTVEKAILYTAPMQAVHCSQPNCVQT